MNTAVLGVLAKNKLDTPDRSITRNRQPGRCCDEGCQTPEKEAVMRFAGKRVLRA